MVRALGRELRLWDKRRAARTRIAGQCVFRGLPASSGVALLGAERGWRIRRNGMLLRRCVAERKRCEHSVTNGVGIDRLARGFRPVAYGCGARGGVACVASEPGWKLGRGRIYRHGLSAGLLS